MLLARPMAPVLFLRDIHVSFGGTALLERADLSLEQGDRLCVVGRNGSGKSTLLKIAAGMVDVEDGERFFQPGATIRYLPQEPDFTGFRTLEEYTLAGLGPSDNPHRVTELFRDVGLTGQEDPAHVSGGEARRAALVRVLAPEPDVLLLDEPTNHLDLPAIEWLENTLASMRSALVLISHDRRFLSRLSHNTLWLDRGRTRLLRQGFAQFEAWRDETLEQEEIDRHKLDRKIADEEHWLRYGVSARRKRNVKRLAGLLQLRQDRRDEKRAVGEVKLDAAEAADSGSLVIKTRHAKKSYGDKIVVRDFSIRIKKGNRIGIVGANGSGKTTLLNLLTGKLKQDSGEVKIGMNVVMASLDQDRAKLLPDSTLAEVLTDGRGDIVIVDGKQRHVISYMKDFLFSADQVRQPVRVLSGGERARLLLAKLLARPSNLLVLDEPTNDLDLETLDLLQEMIADYSGTVLLVSHDRDFLDRTVGSIIMAEGDGRFVEYAGGYSDMVAQRGGGVSARVSAAVPAARAAKEATSTAAAPAKRRMTFKDKHALEELPRRISETEREIARLQYKLHDPDLYGRDPAGFATLSAKLAEAEKNLSTFEDRWIELEMLRAEIEGMA